MIRITRGIPRFAACHPRGWWDFPRFWGLGFPHEPSHGSHGWRVRKRQRGALGLGVVSCAGCPRIELRIDKRMKLARCIESDTRCKKNGMLEMVWPLEEQRMPFSGWLVLSLMDVIIPPFFGCAKLLRCWHWNQLAAGPWQALADMLHVFMESNLYLAAWCTDTLDMIWRSAKMICTGIIGKLPYQPVTNQWI
jgi:hypothetical protein